MLSKLSCHLSTCSRPQQHRQLVWQQQQEQQYCRVLPNPIHADRIQASRGSSRVPSTLEKLNIQPLSLPAEARQLQQPDAAGAAAQPQHSDLHIPQLDAWGQDPFLMSGCEPESAPLRVAVLVSGGVDSSLALKLVTAAGHRATAFYLQIWFQEDFRNFWDACPWEEDLGYAQQVCEALGVPLVVVPLTQQYWDRVVSHSVAEIKQGRTPNPDMLCNSRVKFGAFYEYLQQEHAGVFDRIASGHYAKLQRTHPIQPPAAAAQPGATHITQQQQQHQQQGDASLSSSSSSGDAALLDRQASHAQASSSGAGSSSSSGAARLLMVPDAVKDQTYFLASLSPGQLGRCMFPLGSFTKPQVRALASAAGLATSGRKDSQGICFLGKVKFGEFVAQHLGQWPGPLVEEDSGQVVGLHEGYWFYTVGQRGGIKLPGGPWYVTRKDMATNVVYVSRSYYERERRRDAFVCGPFNWLGAARPGSGVGVGSGAGGVGVGGESSQPSLPPLLVKVRHGPTVYECSLRLGGREEVMEVLEVGSAASFGSSSSSSSSSEGSSDGRRIQGAAPHEQQHEQYGVVLLSENDQGLAAGQYAVFYQGEECLGSAQILGSLARTQLQQQQQQQ